MFDLVRMREKCQRLQWRLDDVDWDAPGAEAVTPERAAQLQDFLGDLYWIETTASIVFGAMEGRAEDPLLQAIFASFHVDERRHADAELRLMWRWGMLPRGERPTPTVNLRWLVDDLERNAHRVHPAVFSALIPMTELVLDGALVKYLHHAITDPVCTEVFNRINADEARHLAVDFHVLEKYGREKSPWWNATELARSLMRPGAAHAMVLGYVPMLARSGANIRKTGLDMAEVQSCLRRYAELGDESADIARHPAYRLIRAWTQRMATGARGPGEWLARLSDAIA